MGRVFGPDQLGLIANMIPDTQLTLIETTQPKANVALEMGLSLGSLRGVIALKNTQTTKTANEISNEINLPGLQFLSECGYIQYDFSEESLEQLVKDIIDKWKATGESDYQAQIMVKDIHSNKKIRRETMPKLSCYIHYPKAMESIYAKVISELRRTIHKEHFDKTSFPEDCNHFFCEVQNVAYLVNRATHVVVETGSDDSEVPDLLSCFVLGYAYAIEPRRKVLRIEFDNSCDKMRDLSMWPNSKAKSWNTNEDLQNLVKTFIEDNKKKKLLF